MQTTDWIAFTSHIPFRGIAPGGVFLSPIEVYAGSAQLEKMFNEDKLRLGPLERIQLRAATTPVSAHRFLSVVRLIRPEQWVKNVFVHAPLLFTPTAISAAACILSAWR